MRRIVAAFVFALLCCSNAVWAGYFIEDPVDKKEAVRELPSWFFGGSVDVGFYLNSFDAGFGVAGEYRIHKNHSLALSADYLVGGELFDFGLDWRIFFSGTMMEDGYNDYIRTGIAGFVFDKADEVYVSPQVMLGYGRDFMPLKNADFMCRLEIRLSYLLGEDLAVEEGMIYHHGRLVSYLSLGVFFF